MSIYAITLKRELLGANDAEQTDRSDENGSGRAAATATAAQTESLSGATSKKSPALELNEANWLDCSCGKYLFA